jgi:hypothetical protein
LGESQGAGLIADSTGITAVRRIPQASEDAIVILCQPAFVV